jgi:alkanesulfonate monooxygenase SsuD/methylene tetrahydromethanopterin reductase-like flavin-dependent oxidoreductase (luciferase family)
VPDQLRRDERPSLLITGGGGLGEIADSARMAEAASFAGAWCSEFYDRSATVALAAMAAATSSITLGSAIAYAATEAAT